VDDAAVAARPEALLAVGCDPAEVSIGLAPMIVDEIFAFFGRLSAEGSRLLIVEQYVTKALAVADLVYLLARSRIVFAGEPAELAGSDIFAKDLATETAGAH
jgi:branched-chain amino acid transport system ATP-binding protein